MKTLRVESRDGRVTVSICDDGKAVSTVADGPYGKPFEVPLADVVSASFDEPVPAPASGEPEPQGQDQAVAMDGPIDSGAEAEAG